MKRLKTLILAAVIMAGMAQAQTFTYLNLTKSDNSMVSLAADGLKLTFSDGNIVAKNGSTTQAVALADVVKMKFSDDTNGVSDLTAAAVKATGCVGDISVNAPAGVRVMVYNLLGSKIYDREKAADGEALLGLTLQQGVYVVRIGTITNKVLVR